MARDRIRVNGLNLGWATTPNEHEVQTRVHGRAKDWAVTVGQAQPFGRLLDAQDAARAIKLYKLDTERANPIGV